MKIFLMLILFTALTASPACAADININQISPLDKLELLLTKKEENINFDISCLKHIKKKNDEILALY